MVLLVCLSPYEAVDAATAPVVVLPEDRLSGTESEGVEWFLGVPYARAPVGALHWRAPQPVAHWSGTRIASQPPASCMQSYPAPTFGPYTAEFVDTPAPSEDCLYLNVWTPGLHGRYPVLVWIHGGAFLGGSGSVPIYDGTHLASKGVVVVTINYRVGPLRFLAHPALSAESPQHVSGNYGLQDQIAALRWVRRSIQRFGGDPAKVTIAGQSAGAASVDDLLVAPEARGLFQRAITESGSGMGIRAPSLSEAEADGNRFAAYLGASNAAALRALPAERIQAAVYIPVAAAPAGPPPPMIRFGPVLDGRWLPLDPARPAGPMPLKVPLLTGFNADEELAVPILSASQLVDATRRRYGAHAEPILSEYPHASDEQSAQSSHLLTRDRLMTALLLWTRQRLAEGSARIWAYRFDYPVPVAHPPGFGAFHSAEIPYVFGNLNGRTRPYGAADHELSDMVQGYWLNFMRSGNPNGPGLAGWTAATADGVRVLSLTLKPAMVPAVSSDSRFDALRSFVRDGGLLTLD